jgi:flagellar hook protein FlgE
VYATSLNGAGTNQVGIGVRLRMVAQQFTQGNITTTEQPAGPRGQRPGFFQVHPDGRSQPGDLHPQRPVQARPRRLHRQQRADKLLGYAMDDAPASIQPGRSVPLQLPTAASRRARPRA